MKGEGGGSLPTKKRRSPRRFRVSKISRLIFTSKSD
jgi:hypothetical protein